MKKKLKCNKCTKTYGAGLGYCFFWRFVLTGILSILISCKSQGKKATGQSPPNILIVLVDDLGAFDLGYTGSSFYESVQLDKLASNSFVFTQGYAASAVCSPSRASILTGKYTPRHGITDWIGARSGESWRERGRHTKLLPASYDHQINRSEITIAEQLIQHKYKTFFAGKWHLGGEGSLPEDNGFETNIGGWEKGSPKGGYYAPWLNPKLPNREHGESLTMRLANETVDFMEKNRDSTFFAFLSFYAVHAPIQTTQEKWKKYQKKAKLRGIVEQGFSMERVFPIRQVQDNPVYAGLVETMDDAIGRVLTYLETSGLAENTIVVFTSDNGGVASGDAFATSNLPLRGGKGYQWEGGIRVPYLIYVPWLKNRARKIHVPVSGIDLYPTLLDLAGLDFSLEQQMDGVSLEPLLSGKDIGDRALYWHYPHYGNQGGEPNSIILENQWKLIYYWEDGRKELYNLTIDLGENQEVSQQNPLKVEELSEKLTTWLKTVQAKTPVKDMLYNETKAAEIKQNYRTVMMPKREQIRQELLSDDFVPNKTWWDSKAVID